MVERAEALKDLTSNFILSQRDVTPKKSYLTYWMSHMQNED